MVFHKIVLLVIRIFDVIPFGLIFNQTNNEKIDKEGAVHTREKMMVQVRQLIDSGSVTTVSGNTLPLHANTLCVHGDNEAGVKTIADIRALNDT